MSTMNILAFLALAAAAKPARTDAPPARPCLPNFKRRWWYSERRLDARPVIWSLKNHPEEWRYRFQSRDMLITHSPSRHSVWFLFHMGYRLDADGCSCSTRNKWQRFQLFSVGRAVRAWRRWEARQNPTESIDVQFRSHFIH